MAGDARQGRGGVNHLLLFLTLLVIGIQPIGTAGGGLLARGLFGALLVGCMAAVHGNRRLFPIGIVLGVPALGLLVFMPTGVAGSAGLALGIATIAFVCYVLLLRIYERPVISSASVSGSLVVYLLLGILWSMAYTAVELNQPGSFYGLSGGGHDELSRELFYYSYVTLTTLGYGDIGPVSPAARSLASMEAIVGQLYLVVLVASLVGMFLADRIRSTE